jgi:hypothetical protein
MFYERTRGSSTDESKDGEEANEGLVECGPRFTLFPYKVILGTVDQEVTAEVEWVYRPYMNSSKRRRILTDGLAVDTSQLQLGARSEFKVPEEEEEG